MQTVKFASELILFYSEKNDGNMDERFGTSKEVRQNRQALFSKHNLNYRDAIEPAQIHFDRLLVLNPENTKMWRGVSVTGIDGFVTQAPEALVMVRVADCVPLLIFDPENHALGLFHAGWRGIVKGIAVTGLARMIKEFKTDPAKALVWIGPSARFCHYQIKEIPEQVSDPLWEPFIKKQDNHYLVDMVGYVKFSLQSAGILKSHIKDSHVCTIETDNLFSHQRSAASSEPEGRFIVAVQLLPATAPLPE